MTKIYCKLCDKICTVSEYSYAEILKLLKVPAEKLVLTYNFVLPSQINIANSILFIYWESSARKKYCWDGEWLFGICRLPKRYPINNMW